MLCSILRAALIQFLLTTQIKIRWYKSYTLSLISIKKFLQDAFAGVRREGSFSQNYALVLSGTGLTILVQIFVTPILTRIYGPEAYGTFSVFNAVSTNLALLAGLRLPQAMLLPKEEEEFYALARLCFLSVGLFSLLLFTWLFINPVPLLALFSAEKLASYYFLIPISVFLIAANQILGQWQYRLNLFKKSVAIDTSILIGVRVFNLGYGFLSKGMVLGLVLGDVAGKLIGLLVSWVFVIKSRIQKLFTPISTTYLKETFVKYKQFPLYNLPGVWLLTFSEQLPIFFISSYFGLATVGFLSLATSMMDLPKRLFAYSVSSVFYKKANDLKQKGDEQLTPFVLKIVYLLAAVAILPYATVVVFGQELFSFAFGNQWLLSGKLAQYLALYYVFELLYISVDSIFYVLRQEKKMFFFQAATLLGRVLVIGIAMYLGLEIEACVILLTGMNLALYISQLSYVLHLLHIKWLKHILKLAGLLLAGVALLYLVKLGLGLIGKY